MKPPRKRAQAIAKGRPRDHRIIIPLAFEVAARISARPLEDFCQDATQLANGLKELHQAIEPDGLVVSMAGELESASANVEGPDATDILGGPRVAASLEACRRLRDTFGDEIVLLAGVTGPMTLASAFGIQTDGAGECLCALVKAFLEAGSDLVLLIDEADVEPDEAASAALKTATNIARFHQASLLSFDGRGLPAPHRLSLDKGSAEGLGFIVTDAAVPADYDIARLRQWVVDARGDQVG